MTNGQNLPSRETKFHPVDFKAIEADGTFEGYASLFGKEDLGKDMVLPGAFRESLAQRGTGGVKMLFQHDPDMPIGVWVDLYEDNKGLFVRGRLMPDVEKSREVLSLMRAGALDGLSIGFRTVKGRTDPKSGVRRLEKIDLWEVSVVTFPMQPDARVSAVKALPTERQFERWLTQDAGFTRTEARTVIGTGFKTLAAKQDAAGGPFAQAGLAATIRQAAETIRCNIMRTQ